MSTEGAAETKPRLSPARLVVRTVLGVLAGLGVAAFAAYQLDVKLDDVAHHVGSASPWAIALAVASGFVVIGLQTLRWHLVMKPLLGLRYLQAYRAQVVGMMFNALIPAPGGDLLRVQYL